MLLSFPEKFIFTFLCLFFPAGILSAHKKLNLCKLISPSWLLIGQTLATGRVLGKPLFSLCQGSKERLKSLSSWQGWDPNYLWAHFCHSVHPSIRQSAKITGMSVAADNVGSNFYWWLTTKLLPEFVVKHMWLWYSLELSRKPYFHEKIKCLGHSERSCWIECILILLSSAWELGYQILFNYSVSQCHFAYER